MKGSTMRSAAHKAEATEPVMEDSPASREYQEKLKRRRRLTHLWWVRHGSPDYLGLAYWSD